MNNYIKILTILIILIILLAGIFLYFNKVKENSNVTFKEASLKILSSWGPCSVPDGCHEVYELNSKGEVLYNNVAKGNFSGSKAREFIQTALNLYKNNICTRFDITDVFENYELNIDGKVYEFGKNQGGCKEMQNMFDVIKKSVGI
jgi:hypothetical protein